MNEEQIVNYCNCRHCLYGKLVDAKKDIYFCRLFQQARYLTNKKCDSWEEEDHGD